MLISEKNPMMIEKEEPPKKVVPDPVAKLPQEKIESLKKKIEQIIELGRKLSELSKKWKLEINDPIDTEVLRRRCDGRDGSCISDKHSVVIR